MRLLIGYDGSKSADMAVDDLRRAGLPDNAEALIVSVGDIVMSAAPSSYEHVEHALLSRRVASGAMLAQTQTLRVMNDANEFAAQARDRVSTFFPGWDVNAEALVGDAADELTKKAKEWDADLIVVGSQGRSAVGRLLLGSVSKQLVTNSNSSVRVVRPTPEVVDDAPPKIIIGVDGSSGAERAVRAVGNRVWPTGTEVRIVAVDDGTSPTAISKILPNTAAMITGCNEESAVVARMMVEWAEQELSAIGLRTSVTFEKGDPQGVLVEEARKWQADSIFVGSRDFSGAFERFRLGSVSAALVTKAPCSVEVVR
ncbi:MAG: universal stress protein [Acidobacteriota bacterium]